MIRPLTAAFTALGCLFAAGAQTTGPLTPPPNYPGRAPATLRALVGATVHATPDTVILKGTVVLRDGLIVAAGDGATPVPEGAERIDATGLHIYPAFIEPMLEVDVARPSADAPGAHWSDRVTPQRDALSATGPDGATREGLRKLGFGAAGIVPRGGIFAGTGAVVSLAEPDSDRSQARPAAYRDAFAHMINLETGRGDAGNTGRWASYPDSQMGAIALIRQTLADAQLRAQQQGAGVAAGPSCLDALNRPVPLLFDADDELEVLRAIKISAEFDRPLLVRASGNEFRRLQALKARIDASPARATTLLLPLAFAEAPPVSSIGEAISADLRALMTWEQAPTNPRRLAQAGVPFALTSGKIKDRADFAARLRSAIAHGLTARDALAALTTVPAQALGVADQLGTLAPGKRASLLLADRPIFDKGAKLLDVYIDGQRHTLSTADPRLSGIYDVSFDGAPLPPGETLALHLTAGSGAKFLRWGAPAAPAPPAPADEKVEDKDGVKGAKEAKDVKDAAPKAHSVDARHERADRGRLSLTVDADAKLLAPLIPAGVSALTALVEARDEQGHARVLRGLVARPDGITLPVTLTRRADAPWLGTWRVIEADGQATKPDAKRAVLIDVTPGREASAPQVKVTFKPVNPAPVDDPEKAPKAKDVQAQAEKLDAGTLTFTHALAPLGLPEGTSSDTVTLDLSTGVARLVGRSTITGDDKAHTYVAARDVGDPEPTPDVPADLPGLPFGPFAYKQPPQAENLAIVNATVWTQGAQGIIAGTVLVSGGKIEAVVAGKAELPMGYRVIDATGKHLTPGLIDCHSHTGISGGVNEGGQAVTAEVRIGDVTDPGSLSWYRQLAGGITTANCLHGSANVIGGQNQVVQNRWGAIDPDDLHMAGAIPGIKFALGENVKQSNWGDRNDWRYPQTRMGVEALLRERFGAAARYAQDRAGATPGAPVRRDLELEALAQVLAGERLIHCHSYRQDEILMLARLSRELGFKLGTYQHILEGYKVAREVRDTSIGPSAFADWWGYKVEVQDAIPQAGAIMHEQGAVVSFNSDSDEMARRMNVEAAKALRYSHAGRAGAQPAPGDAPSLTPAQALAFVTINPARQLKIDHLVGSIEPGKQADLALWSADPLSVLARCELTILAGAEQWSLARDAQLRSANSAERARLVQKALSAARRAGAKPGAQPEAKPDSPAAKPPRLMAGMLQDAQVYRQNQMLDLLRRGKDPTAARAGVCGCE
jgi:imidazolonepropionase-like amidohydrolase